MNQSFSRQFTTGVWYTPEGAQATNPPVATSLDDFQAAPPADDSPPMEDVQTAGAGAKAATVAASEVPCTWYLESTETAYTKVGEYHAGTDATGNFRYGKTADSDISVAYNCGAGFSLSGTSHVGNAQDSAVTWSRGPNFHKQLRSKFYYAKYHLTLGPSCTSSSANFGKRWYKVRPYSWGAGALEGSTISGPFCTGSNISTFAKNTKFDRGSSRSLTYGGAVTAFGAGLNATSGYSTRVTKHWDFGSATSSHVLCGTPSVTSSKVVYGR